MKTPEEVKELFTEGLQLAVQHAFKLGITPETMAGWLEQHAKDIRLANKFIAVNKLGPDQPPHQHINN